MPKNLQTVSPYSNTASRDKNGTAALFLSERTIFPLSRAFTLRVFPQPGQYIPVRLYSMHSGKYCDIPEIYSLSRNTIKTAHGTETITASRNFLSASNSHRGKNSSSEYNTSHAESYCDEIKYESGDRHAFSAVLLDTYDTEDQS